MTKVHLYHGGQDGNLAFGYWSLKRGLQFGDATLCHFQHLFGRWRDDPLADGRLDVL